MAFGGCSRCIRIGHIFSNVSPTTEGKAVRLSSWPESLHPVFTGSQPFSIPSPKSIPEANSLPCSIQVSLYFSPVNLSMN